MRRKQILTIGAVAFAVAGMATTFAMMRQEKYNQPGWDTIAPRGLMRAPSNWTTSLPLSDQTNSGRWSRIDAYTDEFNTGDLNGDKWWNYNPDYVGKIPGYYYPGNVSLRDGMLRLGVSKLEPPRSMKLDPNNRQFATAAVRSKTPVLYGYFEIRAKPAKSHAASAFWLSNKEEKEFTEIDVFEMSGNNPQWRQRYHMSAHIHYTPQNKEHQKFPGYINLKEDVVSDFHVYGFEWNKDKLRYYVDGNLVRQGPNKGWHQPLYINLTTGIIPNWFGIPDSAELPATFEVDYIRAWKQG